MMYEGACCPNSAGVCSENVRTSIGCHLCLRKLWLEQIPFQKGDHPPKLFATVPREIVPFCKRCKARRMNNLLLRTFSKKFASRCSQHQIWKLEQCKGIAIESCARRRRPNLGPASRRAISSGGNVNSRYEEVYKRSIEQPEEFWDEVAQDITWFKPYEKVLDDSNSPFTKW